MGADQNENCLRKRREQALRSPMRARILELYAEDEGRSLDAEDLRHELDEWFGRVSLPQIAYHLRWFREAELIPAPCPGG